MSIGYWLHDNLLIYRSFYTDNTPNGQKIAITLEELGLKYETVHIDISTNVQKEEWFLKINRKRSITHSVPSSHINTSHTNNLQQTAASQP